MPDCKWTPTSTRQTRTIKRRCHWTQTFEHQIREMAGVTGLEPATSGVTGQRSNQLSYTPEPHVQARQGHRTVQAIKSSGRKRIAAKFLPSSNDAQPAPPLVPICPCEGIHGGR